MNNRKYDTSGMYEVVQQVFNNTCQTHHMAL